jgi:glucose/arabinose dehydrogenase
MRIMLTAAAVSLIWSMPALAQTAEAPPEVEAVPANAIPVMAVPKAPPPALALPLNTEVFLTMNAELTSKRAREGDMFDMTVSHDVMLGNYVVIPKGALARGEVTWRTGRAVFGKSGKMDIELRYIELNGRRVPITGKYRQEGEGNTMAAVGAVVLVAPLLFISGKSALIPAGRELKATTAEAIPVILPEGATLPAVAPIQAVPQTVTQAP